MANIKSSAKRAALAEQRRKRNASVRSAAKTAVRRFEEALGENNLEEAQVRLRKAVKTLDKAAQKGIIHHKAVARKKSQLYRHLNSRQPQAE